MIQLRLSELLLCFPNRVSPLIICCKCYYIKVLTVTVTMPCFLKWCKGLRTAGTCSFTIRLGVKKYDRS